MKKSNIWTLLTVAMLVLSFQNCGQTPFGALNLSKDSDSASLSSSSYDEPNITSVPYALLSSEQLFKSMASVTGTTINGGLANEYNNRQSVLGSGFDLKLVTSPMLIAVTNLASSFCNETLNREIGQAADQRKFFSKIDFTKPAGNITADSFENSLQSMSLSFWGRVPSDLELQILSEGKNEFVSAYTDTEAKQAGSSKSLMLYTCTAMLSSLDSISF